MCPFIFLINKKFLYDFVLYFLNNKSHYMVYYSLFDLITLFFKKNKDAFYVAWKQLLDQYSIEFLMYFFIEQCIYAQLYVLSFKEKIDDRLEIKKKTNRWFMKHGLKYFSSDEIQDLLFELLLIDSFSKKYQTKILVHLNSFFIQWFQ